MEETVDVILPTHRRPHTIRYSIESVLRQTYPHLELHVVGDGCDDSTKSVVRSFQDPRVHFYDFSKGIGMGYANRNHVLRQSSEKYVAYANDDDLWFPDHLERGITVLRERGIGLVAFRCCPVQVPDTIDPYFFVFDWRLPLVSTLLRNWFTGTLTCIHYRWVFQKVGYWNERLLRFGDRDFVRRVRRSAVASDRVDYITALRFYAIHWDDHYQRLGEPPQKRYLAQLQKPEWYRAVRASAVPGRRTFAVRRRQWQDFARFAHHSGPKFVRFWYQQAKQFGARGNVG